jgi:hypothetical protein
MSRFVGTITIVCVVISQTAYAQPVFFGDCGTLIQGVECVLFDSDNYGVYVVENLGGFGVGDRVRVEGKLNDTCITFCMEGDGCIEQNQISSCAEFDDCGTLIQGVECVLFDSDNFGVYVVPLDGFTVGDRVRVTGRLFLTCVTFCMQGDGCIENATVVACPWVIPTLTEWGMIIFCVLLFGWMAWVIVRRRKAVKVRI